MEKKACYWCAQARVHQVWKGIVFQVALSKSVILFRAKDHLWITT